MMPYLLCKKIENDVYNFPTWQYCKYKDIFDSRIIINSTAKFYISLSYQKDLLSIDTRIFTPSKELFESEKYKAYLSTMSKFHNYSFNNTLLIAMQKPEATLVAGYKAWQKNFERHVNKGEKAIRILAC